MTDHVSLVYTETELKCQDLSDRVQCVMKTRQDNNMTHHTGAIYAKNDNELSDRSDQVQSITKTR